jgi:hypothetical protein
MRAADAKRILVVLLCLGDLLILLLQNQSLSFKEDNVINTTRSSSLMPETEQIWGACSDGWQEVCCGDDVFFYFQRPITVPVADVGPVRIDRQTLTASSLSMGEACWPCRRWVCCNDFVVAAPVTVLQQLMWSYHLLYLVVPFVLLFRRPTAKEKKDLVPEIPLIDWFDSNRIESIIRLIPRSRFYDTHTLVLCYPIYVHTVRTSQWLHRHYHSPHTHTPTTFCLSPLVFYFFKHLLTNRKWPIARVDEVLCRQFF